MIFLSFNTKANTFDSYSDGFPIVFAIACASILLGLMMAINLICKDYSAIKRELRNGIPAVSIVLSKFLLIVFLCIIMSVSFIVPYIHYFDLGTKTENASTYIFFSVLFIMVVSSIIGLIVSSIPRIKPQSAANFVPLIMLFQILFSGFLFGQSTSGFSVLAISSYAIQAIGGGLGFGQLREAPYGFSTSIIDNFAFPFVILIAGIVVCIMLLRYVDLD